MGLIWPGCRNGPGVGAALEARPTHPAGGGGGARWCRSGAQPWSRQGSEARRAATMARVEGERLSV